jgi:hypothetical protein
MPDRHRGNTRDFDRDRLRGFGGPGGAGGAGGRGGPSGRDRRSGPPRERTERTGRGPERVLEPQPFHRDRRPPAPPEEMEDFEEVDATLAVAILQAATKLTEIVGTAGLPEAYAERREAVVQSFEAIYFSILDAITGEDEEEEEEDGE